MAERKNGRIVTGKIAEADGVARIMKTGQRVCLRSELVTKLERYIADKNKSDEDRAMYATQLEDVKEEMANG